MMYQITRASLDDKIRRAIHEGRNTHAMRLADRRLNELRNFPTGPEYAESYMLIAAAYARNGLHDAGPITGLIHSCTPPRRDQLIAEYILLTDNYPARIHPFQIYLKSMAVPVILLLGRIRRMF